jgi:hypothetical protein
MQDKMQKLKNLLSIQGTDGNWNHNDYMVGLYNGMELSIATLESRRPVYHSLNKNLDEVNRMENIMKFIVNGVKFRFIKLPNSSYMQETPITQKQWAAVMRSYPSHFIGKKRPVENVSWDDTQVFIKNLSTITCHV